jgi:hypothetical protein
LFGHKLCLDEFQRCSVTVTEQVFIIFLIPDEGGWRKRKLSLFELATCQAYKNGYFCTKCLSFQINSCLVGFSAFFISVSEQGFTIFDFCINRTYHARQEMNVSLDIDVSFFIKFVQTCTSRAKLSKIFLQSCIAKIKVRHFFSLTVLAECRAYNVQRKKMEFANKNQLAII